MTTTHSADVVTSDEDDNQNSSPQEYLHDRTESSPKPSTPSGSAGSSHPEKSSRPVQKRRRITRACDECRKKKIKCDGKQPCTHCTVYSYECTYDQPSNRRRNPAPAYIEALESRLQKAEAILRTALPEVNLDDPEFDAHNIDQIIDSSKHTKAGGNRAGKEPRLGAVQDDDAQLKTMVEGTGSLELDDQGHWDYHGTSSGFTFIRNLRAQFGDLAVPDPRIPHSKSRAMSHLIDSPKSVSSSPYDLSTPPAADLPDKDKAMQLCRNALEVACALMRFVHKPRFYGKVVKIIETDPEHYTNADTQFLPLLYVVMAVGCLFAQTENTMLDTDGYESAMAEGFQYFQTARNMLDITDVRDLLGLQATTFMIIFLQSTAKLATCYSHVGIALRACCRLGLHRNIKNEFDPIEQEERKRIFWLIRKMDAYVGALLGLPQMLSAEDVDQQLPLEVDDEFITAGGILPVPPGHFPLIRATNAHARVVQILQKVVKYIYPVKGFEGAKAGEPYSISHSRIREIEKDLQVWMDNLPIELRPSDDASSELTRVQQLLRLSYAHVQMMMYRPFLHYVSQGCEAGNVDQRSFACAAACVSVARNIVHITMEMKKRGLLIGSHWFVMYTTYFSILSLVYFVLENPQSATGRDIMRDAIEGRDMLASLAKQSMAADRCSHSLAGLFAELPVKLKERKTSSQSMPPSRKRPNPGYELETPQGHHSAPIVPRLPGHDSHRAIYQGGTLPSQDVVASAAQQASSASSFGVRHAFHGSPQLQAGQRSSKPVSSAADVESSRQKPLSGNQTWPQQIAFGQNLDDNLPDLRDLMYPSTNPFAYGNQPLSILEDSQMIAPKQQISFTGATNTFEIPTGNRGPSNISFDHLNISTFGSPAQHGIYEQQRYDPTPMPRGNPSHVQMPESTPAQGMSNLGMDEGFWPQTDKGRTGLTPGVNLDELFGADGWWNPGYMDQGYGRTQ